MLSMRSGRYVKEHDVVGLHEHIMDTRLLYIFVHIVLIILSDAQDNIGCHSPQYLEYGQRGIIKCVFPESFRGVYWFNSTEFDDSKKIIYYTNSQTQGVGYLSGEYDILPDGSLLIENVTFQHDHVFTVALLNRIADDAISILISVVVTVKPRQLFPKIGKCGGNRFCISEAAKTETLSCWVNKSRPPVNLTVWTYSERQRNWMKVSSSNTFTGETLQTSMLSMKLPAIETFAIYVCAADEPPYLLEYSESVIVVKRGGHFSQKETKQILVEKSSEVVLNCSVTETLFVVWMKQYESSTLDIAHTVTWRGYSINGTDERYHLTNESNLIIRDVTLKDEGTYVCLTGEGTQEGLKAFNITVYVLPKSQEIVVDGCITTHDCSLPVRRTGHLRCGLLGVRPAVPLMWRFVDGASTLNKFQNYKLEVEENQDMTYDITMSSEYNIQDTSKSTVYAECFVERANDISEVPWLHLSTQVSLQVVSDVSDSRLSVPLVILIVVIIILQILHISVTLAQPKCRERRENVGREDVELGK